MRGAWFSPWWHVMSRGADFEAKLARMYRHLGYRVERTQASNDHGADLLLTKHGRTIAVQAKSYAKPVGNKAVQEAFAAQAYYGTRAAWVVTDSTFTAGAIAQAKPCGVRLIDGADLRALRRKARRRRWLPVLGALACAALLAFCVLNPQGAAHLASWAQAR